MFIAPFICIYIIFNGNLTRYFKSFNICFIYININSITAIS
nr:MAG TPA: hypothetical protein [Bacteriophage sp.]